jgi:hypothetical protein
VDGNDVGEPKRDIGKVFRENFLDFTAEGLALFLIHFHVNLIGERVNTRVAVVSAIGAVGREAFRGVNEFEDADWAKSS